MWRRRSLRLLLRLEELGLDEVLVVLLGLLSCDERWVRKRARERESF